ncbi:hypothetical protein BU15DRAFT_81798 [Melanogaster broomeanus]|nr:hypothetical protein BU15DRAFT_81798 [Melanogaster broomeanus]
MHYHHQTIVLSEHPNQSEYIAAGKKRREWISVSGFSGSAGQAIISKTAATLSPIAVTGCKPMRNWIPIGTSSQQVLLMHRRTIKWLMDRFRNAKIGIDACMISHDMATQLLAKLNAKWSRLVFPSQNFTDLIWKENPSSLQRLFIQFIGFTGREPSSKIAEVRQWTRMQPPAVPAYSKSAPTPSHMHVGTLITSLSNIVHLLNLHGSDIPFNPLFYAYLFISLDKVILFLDSSKLTDDTEDYPHSQD